MIARLRRRLLGDPCPLCALPVRPEARGEHLAWHHAHALADGLPDQPNRARGPLLPEQPTRGAQPERRRNGGPR